MRVINGPMVFKKTHWPANMGIRREIIKGYRNTPRGAVRDFLIFSHRRGGGGCGAQRPTWGGDIPNTRRHLSRRFGSRRGAAGGCNSAPVHGMWGYRRPRREIPKFSAPGAPFLPRKIGYGEKPDATADKRRTEEKRGPRRIAEIRPTVLGPPHFG